MIWQKQSKLSRGLPARVTLSHEGRRLGSFQPLHLHDGGMLLQGKAPAAPGEVLEVELPLASGAVARAAGLVARQGCPHASDLFTLLFVALTGEARTAVQQLVRAGIEQDGTATALVVDDSPEICAALRRELLGLGHTVVAVDRIEDAVRLLERENQLSVALVNLFLVADDGRDLLAYLAGQHPRVRRILMSGELALSRVPRLEDLAQSLLVKPWTRAALAEALQHPPEPGSPGRSAGSAWKRAA